MRNILFYISILILLIGCGGGGGGENKSSNGRDEGSSASVDFPSDNIGATSYNSWDYITPSTTPHSSSIKSRNLDGTAYNATFRSISSNTKVETPLDSNGETVEYQKLSNSIKITFKKDNNEIYSYYMKKELHLGETTTIDDSSCELVNHYDTYIVNQVSYKDVIEIDCGKHKGFYAKYIGEISKN